MQQVQCHLRQTWVAATPEEIIRQRLLRYMTAQRHYPRALLALEAPLPKHAPQRRLDIVCYTPNHAAVTALEPLLIIECKAVPLNVKALRQAAGYNYFMHAPFIAIANAEAVFTSSWSAKEQRYLFWEGLPAYDELLRMTAEANKDT